MEQKVTITFQTPKGVNANLFVETIWQAIHNILILAGVTTLHMERN